MSKAFIRFEANFEKIKWNLAHINQTTSLLELNLFGLLQRKSAGAPLSQDGCILMHINPDKLL